MDVRRKPLHQNTTTCICINMCSEKKTSVNCELEELGVCASKLGAVNKLEKNKAQKRTQPIRMGPQTSTNNFLTYSIDQLGGKQKTIYNNHQQPCHPSSASIF
jgi:hypothetical protein